MSFPAGPLPTVGMQLDLAMRQGGTKSIVFAHGGSDLDLTDPANKFEMSAASSFYCTASGNLVFQLAGDSATRTIAVAAGQQFHAVIVLVKGTSTADGVVFQ